MFRVSGFFDFLALIVFFWPLLDDCLPLSDTRVACDFGASRLLLVLSIMVDFLRFWLRGVPQLKRSMSVVWLLGWS